MRIRRSPQAEPTREQLDRHTLLVDALYDLAAECPRERRRYVQDMILFAEVNPGRWDLTMKYVEDVRAHVMGAQPRPKAALPADYWETAE